MKKASTKTKSVKISERTRSLYAARDRRLDNADPDAPVLPPEMWEKGVAGKYYRPLKTSVSLRLDSDVLAWLKLKGPGHLTRINGILRAQMQADRKG
jgi:uncharacterized protein (DUF4415 family)